MNVVIANEYREGLSENLLEFLSTVASTSRFEHPIWFFDRLKRSEGHSSNDYKIHYASTPSIYAALVKYWVLLRIRSGIKVPTAAQNVALLNHFLSFMLNECCGMSLDRVNRLTIEAFEMHLESKNLLSRASKEGVWTAISRFFEDMQNWPGMPTLTVVPPENPFSRRGLDRMHSQRLIPDDVLEQLDRVFRDERIPLESRLMYWLLRSIPSRVQELTTMAIECLRRYRDGWVIFLDNWKQSGSQHTPTKRVVHIKDEGHGAFLLEMIRKQQAVARELEKHLPEEKQGFLFTSRKRLFGSRIIYKTHPTEKVMMENICFVNTKTVFILNRPAVIKRFKKIALEYDIRDSDGELFNVITHAFRHNGITERLYEGFSYVEIRDMTGHKSNQMLVTSYAHTKEEEILARAKEKREKGELGPPVLFKGRILNLTPETEARLLRNPRAYRIKDLGICSDITSCSGDLFECLACPHLAPDAENEEYYIEEHKMWSERAAQHQSRGNKMLAEQSKHMAELHQKLLERMRLGLLMAKEGVGDAG